MDGKPSYTYNFLGLQSFTVSAADALPAGMSTIRYEFVYDGGGVGKGGASILYVGGKKVAEDRIPHTQAIMFSADETADVGVDDATPVVVSLGGSRENRFTGKIRKVTVEVK
jgi:arylsulfatase